MVGVRGGWAIAVVVAAGAVILPLLAPTTYWQGLVVLAAVFALLGLSVNLPSGYLGYLSFGHAAFFGLGGYAAALLTIKFGVDYWIATFVAAVPGIALGALVGFASLRVGGAYFAITSLTVAEILRLVADNWVDLTRGPMGLILPRPTIPVLADLGISFPQYYLAITIPVVGGCFLLVRLLLHSPEGRAWIAIRESVDLAESVGIATVRHRVINLAISGGLAAIAGALLIPKILVISPQLFSPLYSATGLLIVLLGGKGTLVGPVIGGTLFAVLPEAFRFVDEYRVAIFALLLLVIVRVRPDGLAPLFTKFVPTPYEGEETAAATIPDAPGPRAGEAASGPLLEVVGLEKRFSGVVAVDALEFSVGRGEIVGLMGPNGAGKTTCLSMLSGFLAPSAGSVRFDGGQISGLSPHAIARRGMVRTFQHTTLFLGRPVLENVLIAAGGMPTEFPCGLAVADRRLRAGREGALRCRPPRAEPCRPGGSRRCHGGFAVLRRTATAFGGSGGRRGSAAVAARRARRGAQSGGGGPLGGDAEQAACGRNLDPSRRAQRADADVALRPDGRAASRREDRRRHAQADHRACAGRAACVSWRRQ
jgi:branched-chain amino acid transport system permease protein